MKDEYVKVKCALKQRILFLFTGLLNKKYLINTNTNIVNIKEDVVTKDGVNVHLVDAIPDKIDIPFFELNQSDVQSNLNE